MTPEFVFFVVAGAFSGGFINGLAGFGTSLFALGWWLQVMSPIQAVSIALVMSVVSGIQGVILVRKDIVWSRLALFLVPALFGIPIGLQILRWIDANLLTMAIALFLLLFGSYFLFRRELPNIARATPLIDTLIGFTSGILGAVAGLSGSLPTIWLSLRDWTKKQTRAVLQPFNVAIWESRPSSWHSMVPIRKRQ